MPESTFFTPTNVRSPLSTWMGGKSHLAKHIIKKILEPHCYVRLFAVAAWVLFRKPESKVEIINDINKDIINLSAVCSIILKSL